MKKSTKFILIFIIMLVIVYIGYSSPNKNSMQLSFTREQYLHEHLHEFKDNDISQIISKYEIDNIKQIFYSKENSKSCFCYLEINGKKYDIGISNKDSLMVDNKIVKTNIKFSKPIYKLTKLTGSNNSVSYYIIIKNDVPEILYTIENCEEFKNMSEIMTISSKDTITKTIMYRWTEKEICVYNMNKHFKADYVRFNPDNSLIEIIDKCSTSNYMTKEKVIYKLKGVIVNKI